jgi:uncharacterized membrane protein YtjA (UPF0391 family)
LKAVTHYDLRTGLLRQAPRRVLRNTSRSAITTYAAPGSRLMILLPVSDTAKNLPLLERHFYTAGGAAAVGRLENDACRCNPEVNCLARQLLLMMMEAHTTMLHWTLVFLVIALIAGVLGFVGIAGTAAEIAKILFFVFLVLWLISFVSRRRV